MLKVKTNLRGNEPNEPIDQFPLHFNCIIRLFRHLLKPVISFYTLYSGNQFKWYTQMHSYELEIKQEINKFCIIASVSVTHQH